MQHARTYRFAYNALKSLDGIGRLKELKDSDLKMLDNIVEENRIGQSSHTVAWFWRIGEVGDTEKLHDWVQEGKHYIQY